MKKILFPFFLLILFGACRKDEKIETGALPFMHFYGSASDETARDTRILPNGDIITCGYGIGQNGSSDLFLICTDAEGNEKWRRFYGSGGDELCWSFDICPDGGYVMAGQSNSYGSGGYDFYIVKTDLLGTQEWFKVYGGNSDEFATDIRAFSGGFLLCGSQPGMHDENALVIRLDADGDSLWSFNWGGNGNDGAMASCAGADGSHIVIGYTNSTVSGGTDGFLLSVDDNGQELFHHYYGTPEYDEPHAVIPAVDGNGWVICGHYGADMNISSHNVFLTAIAADGAPRWRHTYGGVEHDGGENIAVRGDHYGIVARSNSRAGSGEDLYLVETDRNGVLYKERWLGTNADDAGYGIAADNFTWTVCGYSRGGPFGGKDIYLERLR